MALGYALCRYDGSDGEERASTKTSGNCGIHKLGFVVSVEEGEAASAYLQILNRSWTTLGSNCSKSCIITTSWVPSIF